MSTYYTNSKELKPQILNPNHITESYDIIKFYIKTRYSQELELSSYTQSANKEIINIKRELNESAISIRRITFDIPFIECFEEIAKEKLNQFVKSDQCVDFKNNLS